VPDRQEGRQQIPAHGNRTPIASSGGWTRPGPGYRGRSNPRRDTQRQLRPTSLQAARRGGRHGREAAPSGSYRIVPGRAAPGQR
jgi:hypothetical protein